MLQDYDCVMLEGTLLPGRDLPHIENPQLHAFKTLSELVYRSKLKYENELSQVEPFLVVLSEELLYFFQSGFNSMFIADMIKDAKKYNLKFVTAEDISMDVRLANLRDRLQPFVKCRDINGLKKLATLDKISELPQRIFSGITCDMSIMSKYAYYITVGVNSNRIYG